MKINRLKSTTLIKLEKLPVVRATNSFSNQNIKENVDWKENILSSSNINFSSSKSNIRKKYRIECSGICHPNPAGIGCWAFVVYDAADQIFYQDSGCLGWENESITNNFAEYQAVIAALVWSMKTSYAADIEILTSSQLVVGQIRDGWKCNQAHLEYCLNEAFELFVMTSSTLKWIPQKENKVAQALSNFEYVKAQRELRGEQN